jgi:hypothetical protein
MSAQPTSVTSSTMLRRVLALDAIVTAGNGVIYLVASRPVGDLLGVPPDLLLGLGIILLVYGAAVGYLAARPAPPTAWVEIVITANTAWVLGSVAVLAFGWLSPSTAGLVWIPAQAVVVAGFAVWQVVELRRRDRG